MLRQPLQWLGSIRSLQTCCIPFVRDFSASDTTPLVSSQKPSEEVHNSLIPTAFLHVPLHCLDERSFLCIPWHVRVDPIYPADVAGLPLLSQVVEPTVGPGHVGVPCSGVLSAGGGGLFLTLRYHLEKRTLRRRDVPDPSGTFLTIGPSREFLAHFHCPPTCHFHCATQRKGSATFKNYT